MTTPAPAPQTTSKGCGPIIVVLISIFFLTIGLLVGAGGLYGYLAYSSSGLKTLGLADSAPSPVVVNAEETPRTTKESAPEVYAMTLPIPETISIQGEMSANTIQNRLTRERATFQECYREELKRSPNTRGEMSLQFTVSGSSGDVVAAVSRGNYTESERLSRCVLGKIREWSFEPPKTSGVVVVRFDILFLPFRAVGT